MGKRFITLALVLLIAGAVTLSLGLFEKQKEKKQLEDIRQFLNRLENVNTENVEIRTLAQIFSSDNWQHRLDQYNKSSGTTGLLIDASLVFIVTAAIIFAVWFLYKIALPVRCRLSVYSKNPFVSFSAPASQVTSSSVQENVGPKEGKSRIFDILAAESSDNQCEDNAQPISSEDESASDAVISVGENPQMLFSELEQTASKKTVQFRREKLSKNHHQGYIPQTEPEEDDLSHAGLKKELGQQKLSLEKQIYEFKKLADTVNKNAMCDNQNIGKSINELILQVSAIREFAISQQNRIIKLQEGYDWNIIKSFGLKVIRCIDNVEQKISDWQRLRHDSSHLEHIRDEMVFALESSGIEQYKPQINSEYRGQERIAETVRDRAQAISPEQNGKIAQVVRPGYRHFIDEDNFKVIRTAAVKLFG
jgi:hypothetical protein